MRSLPLACAGYLLAGVTAQPQPSPHQIGWLRACAQRFGRLWLVKMSMTIGGMAAFFWAYFWLLEHPMYPVTVMPLTALDEWLTFRPETLGLYLSLWVYVSLPLALLKHGHELVSHGLAWISLALAGLGAFFFWPTMVPLRTTDREWWLKTVDAAGNACPSLHVAFAVLSAVWLDRVLREVNAGRGVRVGNLLWCAAIVYSTLATRQHVALDVAAGSALGLIIAWFQGKGSGLEYLNN